MYGYAGELHIAEFSFFPYAESVHYEPEKFDVKNRQAIGGYAYGKKGYEESIINNLPIQINNREVVVNGWKWRNTFGRGFPPIQ